MRKGVVAVTGQMEHEWRLRGSKNAPKNYDSQAELGNFYVANVLTYREMGWFLNNEQDHATTPRLKKKLHHRSSQFRACLDDQLMLLPTGQLNEEHVRKAHGDVGIPVSKVELDWNRKGEPWNLWRQDQIDRADEQFDAWVSAMYAITLLATTRSEKFQLRKELNPRFTNFKYFLQMLERLPKLPHAGGRE